MKSPGLNLGVEKSRVEMFFNPTEIFEEIISEEGLEKENSPDDDYQEGQTESEQRGISYTSNIQMDNTLLCKQLNWAVFHEH